MPHPTDLAGGILVALIVVVMIAGSFTRSHP
jgi:hypothetical protein